MIAVCEITGIGPEIKVNIKDKENENIVHERRLVQVWVKSADEDLQGQWKTIVKLWDNEIDENEGMKVGDAVSLRLTPSSFPLKNGNIVPTLYVKLIGVA